MLWVVTVHTAPEEVHHGGFPGLTSGKLSSFSGQACSCRVPSRTGWNTQEGPSAALRGSLHQFSSTLEPRPRDVSPVLSSTFISASSTLGTTGFPLPEDARGPPGVTQMFLTDSGCGKSFPAVQALSLGLGAKDSRAVGSTPVCPGH